MRSYNPVTKGHLGQIKKALKLLCEAKRPMVYSGGGVVLGDAAEHLIKLIQALGLPITSTLMGLGGFPASDKKFLGMLGMHGTYEANMAMQDCDVLLAVGARFDDRVIGNTTDFLSKPRTIIHIDIDPASISKRVKIDVPIVGDVKSVLADMNELIATEKPQQNTIALNAWFEQIKTWRAKECMNFAQSDEFIKPQYVIQKLHEVTKGDAWVTSDVGQHQMWAAQYYPFDQPRRWINSGGLGTMGVGLPYAMGVQFAYPNAQVACVTGEGSIQMNIQELSTCAQYHLPIKVIMLNNRYLGMVRQWQEFFYENRYSESYMDSLPNFVKLAEAYGHVGMQITKPGDVEAALKEAFAMKSRFVFMDFITDQKENVFPMIQNGKGLSEMILAEDL
jgi:acetolactate synthase-1/2/3 large subunit